MRVRALLRGDRSGQGGRTRRPASPRDGRGPRVPGVRATDAVQGRGRGHGPAANQPDARSAQRSRRAGDCPGVRGGVRAAIRPRRGTITARAAAEHRLRRDSRCRAATSSPTPTSCRARTRCRCNCPLPRRGASRSIVGPAAPHHRRPDCRHRRGDGPVRAEGRRAGLAVPRAGRLGRRPVRTAGARVRQPARSRQLGDARRRERRRTAARTRRSDDLHPDRRVHQSRQQRRSARGYRWPRRRDQHADPVAVWRQRGARVCRPQQHRAQHLRAGAEVWTCAPRRDRRARPDDHAVACGRVEPPAQLGCRARAM